VLSNLGSNARAAYEVFLRHGALFPNQLGSLLQLVPSQVDDVLGELAAAGLVTSDGYPALRTILGVKARRHRRMGSIIAGGRPSGRWTLLRSELTPIASAEDRVEPWCRLLLRRYGVMFRDLLANESAAPPWHALVRVYRKLEARGEVRGGRFVAGVAGEQYAMAETIPALRSASAESDAASYILPATDPMNLTGRIGSRDRIPAVPGNVIKLVAGEYVPAHQDRCDSMIPLVQ